MDVDEPIGGGEAKVSQLMLPERSPERRWVVAGLLMVMVLASMEATVTATAMPTIIGDLHGLEHYAWVASIYLLASTVTMPLYGRLSDVLGRKRVLMFSILLFSVGSVLASMSQTMGQLILFRGMQGLGAGGIMPVVLTILADIFTLQTRAKMQAVFAVVWGGAALAGPALGAFLVNTARLAPYSPAWMAGMLGWRTIFWVNLPAGAAAMVILAVKYHEKKVSGPWSVVSSGLAERLDLVGMGLLGLGAGALLVGVSLASGVTVAWWVPALALVVGVAATAGFWKWEHVAANPVMPPGLMRHRSIGPSWVVSGLLGVLVFAIETYVPLYVQGGRGWSASAAAAAVTPVMLSWSLMSVVLVPLFIRWGFRRVVATGAVASTIGLAGLLAAAIAGSPLWVLTAILFYTGIGFAPCGMGTMLGAQDAAEPQERGVVTSGVAFFRSFGGAMGVGLFGAVFNLLTAGEIRGIAGTAFRPGDLLDPHKLKTIRAEHGDLLARTQTAIAHGLLCVFGGMLLTALLMIVMSRRISAHKHHGKLRAEEVMEAMG